MVVRVSYNIVEPLFTVEKEGLTFILHETIATLSELKNLGKKVKSYTWTEKSTGLSVLKTDTDDDIECELALDDYIKEKGIANIKKAIAKEIKLNK